MGGSFNSARSLKQLFSGERVGLPLGNFLPFHFDLGKFKDHKSHRKFPLNSSVEYFLASKEHVSHKKAFLDS